MDTSAFVMFIYSFIQDFPLNHHPLCILQQLLRWHLHSGNSQTWTQVQIIQCWTVGGYRKPLATVNVAGTGTWCLMPHLYLSVGSMPCCNSDCNTQRITVGHGGNRGQARITKSLLLKKKKKNEKGKKATISGCLAIVRGELKTTVLLWVHTDQTLPTMQQSNCRATTSSKTTRLFKSGYTTIPLVMHKFIKIPQVYKLEFCSSQWESQKTTDQITNSEPAWHK